MARDTLLTLLVLACLFAAAGALALYPVVVESLRRAGEQVDRWLSEEEAP